MRKNIFISLEKEVFTGNVLDIGFKDYGVIYNVYREYNDELAMEYIDGQVKCDSNNIEKEEYDNCAMFFSLSSIGYKKDKKNFIDEIYGYIKEDGYLHIWDIDKGYKKYFNSKIRVLVPNGKIKDINISNFNILKDDSNESMVNLLKDYFNIIENKASDGVYYIKAQKKGRSKDENSFSSNKFKVHTQQLSGEVLKGLYKRFKVQLQDKGIFHK